MNFKIRDLILALVSAFLGSVKGWLVSQIKSLGAIEIFGLRSIGTVCFILPIIIYWNYQLVYDLRCNVTLLLRSVVGNIAVTGYYFGFVNLPMAEASLLFYSTPIFTVILGHLFLDERCGLKQTLSVCLSVSGVLIVCFPHFSLDSTSSSNSLLVGIVGCVIGAFGQAAALVIIRKITHVPPAVVSFWWAVVGVFFSCFFSFFARPKMWDCGPESAFIIFVALTGFVCEICLVASLKSTDAVVVSIALTFEIMWAFVFQIFVNKESAGSMTIVGGIIIILSILLPPFFSYSCSNKKTFDVEQDVKLPK